jgi:hypothetical protein
VGFGTGGGPGSTQPSTAGVVAVLAGPNATQPMPATRTRAETRAMAFTSFGIVDHTGEAVVGPGVPLAGGYVAGGGAAASAASRVRPQWHTFARSGTRRPQVQAQVSCLVSPTVQC